MDVTYQFVPERFSVLDPKLIQDTIVELLDFVDYVDYYKDKDDLGWAHATIIDYSLSYVRVGFLAEKIRRYRIYQHAKEKFNSFKDYCEKGLGRLHWHIKQIIKAARVTIDLAKMGFEILPQNYSQALCLSKYYDEELAEKWDKVINSVPPHLITAAAIDRIANGKEPQHKAVRIKNDTQKKLEELASNLGMTPNQYLEHLINAAYDSEKPETSEEETAEEEDSNPINQAKFQRWVADLQLLIFERCQPPNEPSADTS